MSQPHDEERFNVNDGLIGLCACSHVEAEHENGVCWHQYVGPQYKEGHIFCSCWSYEEVDRVQPMTNPSDAAQT